MHLHVEQITGAPCRRRFVADAEWRKRHLPHLPAGGAKGAPAIEGLRLEVSARRLGENIHLEGEVVADSRHLCSRCLARYRAPVRERFALELEPGGARLPADPEEARSFEREGLHLDDDFCAGWFRGPELHLDRLAAELVMLGLPVQPLCRENCRGLCPVCGSDLNAGRCDCVQQPGASPFASLRGLRDALQAGAAANDTKETPPGGDARAMQGAAHTHPKHPSTPHKSAAGEVR